MYIDENIVLFIMEGCLQIKQEFDIKIEEDHNFQREHGANNLIFTTFSCKSEEQEPSKDVKDFHNKSREEERLPTDYTISDRITTSSSNLQEKSESPEEELVNSESNWSPYKTKLKITPKKKATVIKNKSYKLTHKRIALSKKLNRLVTNVEIKEVIIKNEGVGNDIKPTEDLVQGDKLTCPYCGLKATFQGNLRRHIKQIHVKQEVFMCNFCKYQTARKDHLKLHINMKHTKKEKFKCTFCDFEALSPNTLRNHLNHIHTLHRWYDCEFCEFKTTHSGNLKVHIQGKHKDVELKCNLCEFVAPKKFHLSVHIDQVHESQKLKCSFCSHVSKIRSQLTKHIMKEHPDEVKFKCEFCDYRGFAESNIKAHMTSKHQDGNQNYMCTDCDASYDCFANLKKHRNVKHT